MGRNCFIQMREFGPKGWNKLLPTLFLSDRVDTWIPSGADLEMAYRSKLCPFSEAEFIELIKSGFVRVGVRPENILQSSGKKVFFRPGDSTLDDFLERQFDTDSEFLVVHPEYDSAKIALQEIESSVRPAFDSRYGIARRFVERHLKGDLCLPPFVVERAKQFGGMAIDKIEDVNIRDCMKWIRDISDPREREILLLCSQVIRLAVEHDHFMRRHGCDIVFGHEDYATLVRSVAKAEPYKPELPRPLPATVEQIVEIIDFLLAQNPVSDIEDFLKRHEKLARYRDAIWDLGQRRSEIDQYLRGQIKGINPVEYAFGSEPVSRTLAGTSYALVLGTVVFTLLDGLALGSIASLGLASARVVRNIVVAEKARLEGEATWLGVLVYNTERPTRDQMRRILDDLDYHINKRRVV